MNYYDALHELLEATHILVDSLDSEALSLVNSKSVVGLDGPGGILFIWKCSGGINCFDEANGELDTLPSWEALLAEIVDE